MHSNYEPVAHNQIQNIRIKVSYIQFSGKWMRKINQQLYECPF